MASCNLVSFTPAPRYEMGVNSASGTGNSLGRRGGRYGSENNNNNNNNTLNKFNYTTALYQQLTLERPIKVEKYSRLRMSFVFGDGTPLNDHRNCMFRFNKEDLDSLFLERSSDKPDYSMIFLSSFKILNTENQFPFGVAIKILGLPESRHPDISREILLTKSKQPSSRDTPVDLIKGTKTKMEPSRKNLPIPDPIFTELDHPYSTLSYPMGGIFESLTPKSFCKCTVLDDHSLSCTHDKDKISDTFHTFNAFNFSIICTKLSGNFSRTDNKRVSIEVELKYYFLHYFSQ